MKHCKIKNIGMIRIFLQFFLIFYCFLPSNNVQASNNSAYGKNDTQNGTISQANRFMKQASSKDDKRKREKLYNKAYLIYKNLASKGDPQAAAALKSFSETALPIALDLKHSKDNYSDTEHQKLTAAKKYKLGLSYLTGEGVLQDDKKAAEYFSKAARYGLAEAQNALGTMYAKGQGVQQSYETAVEWYKKAAEQGLPVAQNNLGVKYNKGEGVKQSYQKAVEWFQKAAEHDDVGAQSNLAAMYYMGRGVEQSYEKAAIWYHAAAEKGDCGSQAKLGEMYYNDQGVDLNLQEAAKWWQRAADQGLKDAQNNLATMYAEGRGVKQSYEMAAEMYRRAAEQGLAEAQNSLGIRYFEGRGVERSYDKAVGWYRQAADQGYAPAQFNLGTMYAEGRGVIKSTEEAVGWYRRSANQGYAPAQFNLGVMYAEGQGLKQSYEKAVECYHKAAEQGYASAQVNLGLMYDLGRGVAQSSEKAVEWYQKAAEQGNADAQFNLGAMYEAEQTYAKALKWWQKAADNGNTRAQFSLGVMYAEGRGIEQSYEKAVECYQKAAEQEYADAQANLGLMYDLGKGVKQSYEKAVIWYRKAAQQGVAVAQANLGLLYQSGQGVKQSYREAAEWYQKSAEQGNVIAKCNLAKLYREGQGVEKSYEKALKLSKEAAELGEPFAQANLAGLYSEAKSEIKNNTMAAEWYLKSARQDNGNAQLLIGAMYTLGRGVLKDHYKVFDWLKKSKIYGGKDLQPLDSQLYILPDRSSQSFEDASSRILWVLQDAWICQELENEVVIPLIKEISKKSRSKIASEIAKEYRNTAVTGEADAELKLGILYHYGLGVTQDLERAIQWYSEAAQRGNADAQYILSRTLAGGFGVINDKAKSQRWAKRALSRRDKAIYVSSFLSNNNNALHDISEGQFLRSLVPVLPSGLSLKSSENEGSKDMPGDINGIIKIYTDCAQIGDSYSQNILTELARKGNSEASAALGHLYADISIERSSLATDSDVFQWLSTAAKQGDIKALYRLGRMYEYGWGTAKDEVQAVACYWKAALQWHAPAQKALGEAYRYGRGIGPSIYEALRWYRRAAKQGDAGASAVIKEIADEENGPEAVYALAKAHEDGWGIARDEEEALILYNHAARQGYKKAQYVSAVKGLEGKLPPEDDLEPLTLLTTLAGREARVKYLDFTEKELNRKERKALRELPEQGYYKAQHKLAELYEKGSALSLPTLKDTIKAYQEAIRLYEAAMKSNKPVALTPLERVRASLERLQQMTEEDKLKEDYPGFGKFLESVGKTKEYELQFLHELAFIFDQASLYEGEVKKKILEMAQNLARLSDKKKQAQSLLQQMTALISTKAFKEGALRRGEKEIEGYRLKGLSILDRGLHLIRCSWTLIPLPSECPASLKIARSLLHDPRIELFNSYFKFAESKYDPELFQRSVEKIMHLFDKLRQEQYIKEDSFYNEDDDKYGNRDTLEKLITHNHKPNNRFAHRFIRIADIVYERSQKNPTLAADQLIQWAKRGLNCLTASEEEMNRFYIDTITNIKGDSEALAKEDRTLEMQVALSLAKLRYQLLDEIVEKGDEKKDRNANEQRIHAAKHLEKKARWALGLLGDAEHTTDASEATIAPKYQQMTTDDIVTLVLESYTPDRIAKHIAKQIDEKVIDYDKIGRRLRFQFMRGKIAPQGELDNSLFENEDYVLDHCTRDEFESQVLPLQAMRGNNPNNNNTQSIAFDWEALKGQSYDKARQQRAEFYDEDLVHITPHGAKALLYGLGYLEEF